MKTTESKRMIVLALLLLVTILVTSCATRHPGCMKHYYKDVEMGLAH